MLVALVIGGLAVVAPVSATSREPGHQSSVARAGEKEPFATVAIDAEHLGHVDVQRSDASTFKQAKDGQSLRVGDTVRTDEVGRAEVRYYDSAYTRLDVNTTFTLAGLTEEQGARQVEGSLESGRTWNRAENITESGSFEQSGAGATAAVAGTAFAMECPTRDECNYIAVYHSIVLSGNDGGQQTLDELTTCDANNGQLCSALATMSVDAAADNEWLQANLFLDLVFHGYGPGLFLHTTSAQAHAAGGPELPPVEVLGTTAAVTPEKPVSEDPAAPAPGPTCNGNGRGTKVKPGEPGFDGRPNQHVCD